MEKRFDLLQRKPNSLKLFYHTYNLHGVCRIITIARAHAGRRLKKSPTLVISDALNAHPSRGCKLPYSHGGPPFHINRIELIPKYRVKYKSTFRGVKG